MKRARWYPLTNGLVALWLVATAIVVLVHRSVPGGGWLMVHLLLLGAVSTAILVWSQHFADSLLRRPVPGGRRWQAVRLLGHSAGAVLVVVGVSGRVWSLVLAGGVLVAVVAIAHAATIAVQSRGALPSRFGPLVRFYLAAGSALIIGVGIGVVMARSDIPEAMHDRLYPAHLAFNLLGWIGLTVVGTVILLWPTVLHTRVSDRAGRIARRALWICGGGLVVVGGASLLDLRQLFAVGIVVYLVGVAFVVIEGVRQARQSTNWTFASWGIAAAIGWYLFCTIAFAALVVLAPTWRDAATSLGWLVAPFAVGFAAQVLLGALSYLLPVVLGGGPARSRQSAFELNRAAVYRIVVVNLGIAVYLLPVPSWVRVVDSLLVFAVLVTFLVLAVRAVIASRRVAGAASAPSSPPASGSTSPRHGGAMTAAVATVVIALTVGMALDPVAAGLLGSRTASSVTPTGHTTTVAVSMKDMRFSPDIVEVPAGDVLVIRLTNNDDQVHDLVLASGSSSGLVNPGRTVVVHAGVIGADIDGWCSIAGHRQLGMVMTVKVSGGARPSAHPSASSTGMAGMPGMTSTDGSAKTGPSAARDIDPTRRPPASFTARDAVLPPASSQTVHRYTFTVRDEVREVAPGITQTLWTYNGTAPGPTLRGKVGDRFEITVINDGTMGHSIDFHAGSLAPNIPMRTIQPGQRLTYTFTATRSGIWLYHCSTMPMSLHIANGMFGAVIIDPPGLAAVDREFVLVQSEFYLGPQGGIADVKRIATENPDLVVFNGYANQYVYRPLTVRAGERVRVWILDAGPNRPTAFHVVGGQFDTVFAEGDYLLRDGGSTGTGGSQALALQPAQGGFVELVFPEAGDYPFVTHVMSDAEKGATGTFHVTAG